MFKATKKQYLIKDKMMGLTYRVIATNKTHYKAIELKLNEVVTVNKTQAVKI